MIKEMVREHTLMPMEHFMKVSGNKIKGMDSAKCYTLTKSLGIMGIGRMIGGTALGHCILMMLCIKVNGKIIKDMEKVSL